MKEVEESTYEIRIEAKTSMSNFGNYALDYLTFSNLKHFNQTTE